METVELVILVPVIAVVLLFVVALGRYAYSGQLVEQAARAAVWAAADAATPAQAAEAAQSAGQSALSSAGVSCQNLQVVTDTGDFVAGGTVGVTVTCTASLADLTLSGVPGSKSVSASASAPLEKFRQFGGDR